MTAPVRRYNIVSLHAVMAELAAWIEQTEDAIGNAEDRTTPNVERIGALQERADALSAALAELDAIDE